ncbi:MAG: ROK family protein [Candidatus Omnitrophota bacterium]
MRKKASFTAHPSSERRKKNLLFLNLIRNRKSTSRTEISKLTDTNIVTVSNYINGYLKKGLILETGYDVSSGGRRPELVELNKKWGYAIGIDIAPGRIKGILVDFGMEVLASETISGYEKEKLKASIGEVVRGLLEGSKTDKALVKKIGIAAASGDIAEDSGKIKDEIEKEPGIPVLSGSAALCAAFGERGLNPEASEASKILFIYTSLGEGIFITEDEFYEANNKERKYAYLKPWPRRLGIAEEAKKAVSQGVGTKIVDMAGGEAANITAETVVNAAQERDEIASDLLKTAGTNLSVRVAYLMNLFEPEVVIIGGGAEKAKDFFLNPLVANVKKLVLRSALGRAKVAPAILGEEARVKGSAFLAIREAFIET